MPVAEMASIEEEIVEEFSLFDDPMMQYEYLIDIGRKLPSMPEELQTEANRVKGCQSTVFLHSTFDGKRMYFQADSNTVITKGIIALLVRVLSGQTPRDVLSAELGFIDRIDLRNHLSEQRSSGLTAMVNRMKAEAKRWDRG